ncbi:MAG TPA: CpsD/CapB family tyrosine-protein kinase [Chloroflexota bacterium]|nr:CpsD/CapB family tyrosine-protein kinase [Chloroflexota bacterium]
MAITQDEAPVAAGVPNETPAGAGVPNGTPGAPSVPPGVTPESFEGSAEPAPAAPPAPETHEAPTGLLRLNGPGTALMARTPRDWLLPGADEFFRRIYTRTGSARSEVLAVCSAIAGEGKTAIALGLGVTIAEDFPERRVLVVETDLQKPVLARDFDLDPAPGLVDCLMNDDPIEIAYRPTLLENLHLVPAGSPVTNPGRWLRSSSMALAVDAMRTTHDVIILDVPAVLGNSDALLLTDLADGILFVVRSGVTPAAQVEKALEDIDENRLRGLVLNASRSAIPAWLRRLLGI